MPYLCAALFIDCRPAGVGAGPELAWFDDVARVLLTWSLRELQALPEARGLDADVVYRAQLAAIYADLVERNPREPFDVCKVVAFLRENFFFVIRPFPAGGPERAAHADVERTIFPMLPFLTLVTSDDAYSADFSSCSPCSPRYRDAVAAYYAQLKIDANASTGGDGVDAAAPAPRAPDTYSMASFLLTDYVTIILRHVVQAGLDLFDSYTHTAAPGETLPGIAERFCPGLPDAVARILWANATSTSFYTAGTPLVIAAQRHTVAAGQTLTSLGLDLGLSYLRAWHGRQGPGRPAGRRPGHQRHGRHIPAALDRYVAGSGGAVLHDSGRTEGGQPRLRLGDARQSGPAAGGAAHRATHSRIYTPGRRKAGVGRDAVRHERGHTDGGQRDRDRAARGGNRRCDRSDRAAATGGEPDGARGAHGDRGPGRTPDRAVRPAGDPGARRSAHLPDRRVVRDPVERHAGHHRLAVRLENAQVILDANPGFDWAPSPGSGQMLPTGKTIALPAVTRLIQRGDTLRALAAYLGVELETFIANPAVAISETLLAAGVSVRLLAGSHKVSATDGDTLLSIANASG